LIERWCLCSPIPERPHQRRGLVLLRFLRFGGHAASDPGELTSPEREELRALRKRNLDLERERILV